MADAAPRTEQARAALERFFAQLDAAEVVLVVGVSESARSMRLLWLACALTRLGNGALYPLVLVVLLAGGRVGNPARFVVAAALNLLVAFTIYPLMKRSLARLRPCDHEPSLARFAKPLDRYSCPSGHTMTAVAFSVAMVFAWPAGITLALLLCGLMGWSRVALGHHYPTDVIMGGAIGAALAAPLTALVY